jgi:hypothetical protein
MKDFCKIEWSGPASEASQIVTVFLEQEGTGKYKIIDKTHTKEDGGFDWTVGRLPKGKFVPPGTYRISIESLDGDAFGKPFEIRLYRIPADWIKKLQKLVSIIKIGPPPPDCPKCIILDLLKLKDVVKDLKGQYEFQLFFKNRLISRLGQIGKGKMLPNSVKLSFNKDKIKEFIKQGGNKFQLKMLGPEGNIVHTQDVKLEF